MIKIVFTGALEAGDNCPAKIEKRTEAESDNQFLFVISTYEPIIYFVVSNLSAVTRSVKVKYVGFTKL